MPQTQDFTRVADAVQNDPKILKAKKEILNALNMHRQKITSISRPKQSFVHSYEKSVAELSAIRGTDLWHPYIGSGMGNGALVELADGSVKYDFVSGVGVHFGHCHEKLLAATLDAATQDTIMQTNLQQNRDGLELAKLLVKSSGLDHCFLTTSGAQANENGLKIILQNKSPAHRILAFERCFLGRTLTLSQISDKPHFREGLPLNYPVDYIPFYDWSNPAESTEKAIRQLKKLLSRYPGQYACICFELIQGEAGCYPGSREFFLSLIDILKQHDIAILVDEVQTFGRTDHLFAFQHFGLEQHVDVVTIGKLSHVCATLFKTPFKPRPGLLAQTFTSSTSAIKASHAIVTSLLEDEYLGTHGKNMLIRKHFVDLLEQIHARHPDLIEGPFGSGLMIALTPFGGEKEKVCTFAKALFHAGIICYVGGQNPTRLRFLPPAGGISLDDIETALRIFENSLIEVKSQ